MWKHKKVCSCLKANSCSPFPAQCWGLESLTFSKDSGRKEDCLAQEVFVSSLMHSSSFSLYVLVLELYISASHDLAFVLFYFWITAWEYQLLTHSFQLSSWKKLWIFNCCFCRKFFLSVNIQTVSLSLNYKLLHSYRSIGVCNSISLVDKPSVWYHDIHPPVWIKLGRLVEKKMLTMGDLGKLSCSEIVQSLDRHFCKTELDLQGITA